VSLSAAPPVLPPTFPYTPDLVVLGVVAQFLAGLLLGSSVGKGRPRRLLLDMLGGVPPNLDYLRDAIQAKFRGQAGAFFFSLGSGMLLFGFVTEGPPSDWQIQAGGTVLMVALAVLVLVLGERYGARVLRRNLRDHLREQDFPFEEHVNLTREIGAVFGVSSSPEETLESYVAKVRAAIGLEFAAGSRSRRAGSRSLA